MQMFGNTGPDIHCQVKHAEEIESSHMWHSYPDLVKMDRAKDNPHHHRQIYRIYTGSGEIKLPEKNFLTE
jgi:creatinine amidohydrolase/Fe(II)-dependent formamide hydrolase-like protein